MTTESPYTFSKGDADSTVRMAQALLDLYPTETQGELASLRADVAELADSGEPETIVHELFDLILSARDVAKRTDTLPATATGSVSQLNVSSGGVPKNSVESVEVGFRGIATDTQRNRKHHGRPFQALCLWSDEIITELQAEGHPIEPGFAGENITTTGIDWDTLTIGTQLEIGTVLCQVSSFAVPCNHQRQWFTDGDFSRLHHEVGDISRLYATVIRPGTISVGDTITVEPA